MTQAASPTDKYSGLASLSWVLALGSIMLSAVGLFWLRLWLLAIPLAIAALVVSTIVARRRGAEGVRRRAVHAGVIVSACALGVSLVIALTSLLGWGRQWAGAPQREPVQIELSASADGEIEVVHSGAPAAGGVPLVEVTATGSYAASFTTDQNVLQFTVAAAASNPELRVLRCSVKINGVVVMEQTGSEGFASCRVDVLDAHRQKSEEPGK